MQNLIASTQLGSRAVLDICFFRRRLALAYAIMKMLPLSPKYVREGSVKVIYHSLKNL